MLNAILKTFVTRLIPAILPDLLRAIATSIEQGNGSTLTTEQIHAIMDSRQDVVSACASAAAAANPDESAS